MAVTVNEYGAVIISGQNEYGVAVFDSDLDEYGSVGESGVEEDETLTSRVGRLMAAGVIPGMRF